MTTATDEWKATCFHSDDDHNYSVSYIADDVKIGVNQFTGRLILVMNDRMRKSKFVLPLETLKFEIDMAKAESLFQSKAKDGDVRAGLQAVIDAAVIRCVGPSSNPPGD